MARPGERIGNPRSGQTVVFRRTSAVTGGAELEVESIYEPGSSKPLEHYHPRQEEHFEVLEGALRARVGDSERTLEEGDMLVVPQGTPHAMWNAGSKQARVSWVTRPALRTEEFFETVFRLEGKPGLLQGALLMREYSNEFRLTKPPRPVQAVVYAILAPVARLLGHRTGPGRGRSSA